MKIITYSKIGYNHPAQANWNYGIWKIDIIDTKSPYNMSFTVKETFGGEVRFKEELQKLLPKAIINEVKGVYTSTGTQKITGVASLEGIESQSFINEVIKYYKQK